MPFYKRKTGRNLCVCRRSVAGRTPEEDVRYIYVLARHACRCQHPVEQLAADPDKGLSLAVFVFSGGFADEHDGRIRVSVGEDQIHRRRSQPAAVEGQKLPAQLVERLGWGGQNPDFGARDLGGRFRLGGRRFRLFHLLGTPMHQYRRFGDGFVGSDVDLPFQVGKHLLRIRHKPGLAAIGGEFHMALLFLIKSRLEDDRGFCIMPYNTNPGSQWIEGARGTQ